MTFITIDTNFRENNLTELFKKVLFICTFFVTISLPILSYCQEKQVNKADLEHERTKYQKRIAESMRSLESNNHNQKESMSKLHSLNYQLGLRKTLIENLQHEILTYDEQIKDVESAITRKQKELETFRKEYSDVIIAYNQKEKTWAKNVLAMYFSASSLDELLSRKEYFKQYSQNRQKEMANIHRTNEALKRQQQSLVKIKKEKDELLAEQLEQNQEFEQTKNNYNLTLNKLKNDASGLKRDIEDSRKAIAAIDKVAIEAIKKHENKYKETDKTDNPIEIEPERMDKKKVSTNNTTKTVEKKGINSESGVVFSSFEKAKGFLQMPVKEGFIIGKFGVYQHPAYPKVLLENHGIDIRTKKDEAVLSVFGGEIIAVNRVPGAGVLVMIQHSKEYYTVYAKLTSTTAKVGERVNINEIIGIVGLNQDGVSELQFQVWKRQIRLNPEEWLEAKE